MRKACIYKAYCPQRFPAAKSLSHSGTKHSLKNLILTADLLHRGAARLGLEPNLDWGVAYMFVQTIRSEGLAHFSYLIGDGAIAAVVDPSRDADRYVEAAGNRGVKIQLIFETHRNEDYISGASELSNRTGATVWRGAASDYDVPYARVLKDGQEFEFEKLRLWALATPGHTDDSISIAFAHLDTGTDPVGVFTGDTLFVGDVGRADFYPDRREEVAGRLFDSLHDKLLPLGDQTLIYPAHGAGSACGSGMAQREMSTLGYERLNNEWLGMRREDFIARKVSEHHYYPPYFHRMESANQGKDPELASLPPCGPMGMGEVQSALDRKCQLLDLRSDQSIAGACVSRAISIPLDMLSSFGGWFLNYSQPIILLMGHASDRDSAVRMLVRMGFDRIEGYVSKGFEAWSTAAEPVGRIPGLDVHELAQQMKSDAPPHLLDVRADHEFAEGFIAGAQNVYVGQIQEQFQTLPNNVPLVTYCASGRRALVAAAALVRLGRRDVSVCWGSMKAWKQAGYPLVKST